MILRVLDKIFQFLCSLKLAVIVIVSIAVSLAAGTIVESLHGTPTAQYWVYQSIWFAGLLGLLGLTIFCVAISRLPWKIRHIPFLMAHLGILILLAGSWITQRVGIDGNLRVTEGETASIVELDTASLFMTENDSVHALPLPWIPPDVSFHPISALKNGLPYDVTVDQYITHAEPVVSFISDPSPADSKPSTAIQLHLQGGPMAMNQDIWLWQGDPGWNKFQAGPAWFSFDGQVGGGPRQPGLALKVLPDGSLSYLGKASSGAEVKGKISKDKILGSVIHPGWKGNLEVTVSSWVPRAMPQATYIPSRVQSGNQAPTSAIHLTVAGGAGVWLGLGDRAVLHIGNKEVLIGYLPKRILLPFSVRLERFTVDHDQGTRNPAAYSSRVTVLEGSLAQKEAKVLQEAVISMNEPLELAGYTLYQASYENTEPRPITSIFAVNRDPGRIWKYSGSLLIVLGSIFLFVSKVRKRKRV